MRAPTMMLFSLVIGTTILVFTADKLQQMMGTGQPVAAAPESNEPGFSARAREWASTAWQNGRTLYYNLTGQPPEGKDSTATVVISEDTVEQIWVWRDVSGVQHFSRIEPAGVSNARQILYPRDMPLPNEVHSSPPGDDQQLSKNTTTPENSIASEHLPEILIDEQGESRFLEGLNNFRKYQGQGATPVAH